MPSAVVKNGQQKNNNTETNRTSACWFTSVSLGNDVGNVAVRSEGVVEDVGGVVLAGQRVKHLAVDSDLDVLPLRVTHLKRKVRFPPKQPVTVETAGNQFQDPDLIKAQWSVVSAQL